MLDANSSSALANRQSGAVKKYQEALSSWDDLKKRHLLEKNTCGGVTEDELEVAGFRREKLLETSQFVSEQSVGGIHSSSGQPASRGGEDYLLELDSSHKNQTHPSSGAPPNSTSRGRVSSAADYQNYLLSPKIVPSTSSANYRQSLA